MIDLYVLDTHTLAWYLSDNPKLGSVADTALSDPNSRLMIPALALAELMWMIRKGRTPIGPADVVLRTLLKDSRVTIDPLDVEIVQIAIALSGDLELHDRHIVATAIRAAKTGQQVALLTADSRMTRAGHVKVLW